MVWYWTIQHRRGRLNDDNILLMTIVIWVMIAMMMIMIMMAMVATVTCFPTVQGHHPEGQLLGQAGVPQGAGSAGRKRDIHGHWLRPSLWGGL